MTQPTLPSVVAATALAKGEPGALGKVGYSMVERSVFIAPALWLAGDRELKPLLFKTFMVTLFIEAAVIWQVGAQVRGEK